MENRSVDVIAPDEIGKVIRRTAVSFIKRHYVVSSMYLVGIVLALVATGVSVDVLSEEVYIDRMTAADDLTHPSIVRLSRELNSAENAYYQTKGWFSCDYECTKHYEKMNIVKASLAKVKAERDSLMLEARKTVGPWSVFGISDLRRSFWDSWEQGKESARRMTMFDAVFIGLGSVTGSSSNRDNSLFATLFQLLIQFVMNLTVGLFTSLVVFLFHAWSIIQLYGPSFVSGIALFMLVFCAATATVFTAVGGIFGGLAGGIYLTAKSVAKTARLEAESRQNQQHIHWE